MKISLLLIILILSALTNGQGQSVIFFEDALRSKGIDINIFCDPRSVVTRKVLEEYTSHLIARGIVLPSVCMLNETQSTNFKSSLKSSDVASVRLAGMRFEFQRKAAIDLQKVIDRLATLKISQLNFAREHSDRRPPITLAVGGRTQKINRDWAIRDYQTVAENWEFDPAPGAIRTLIIEELNQGESMNPLYKGRNGNKPRMRSVAIPGASQHMLLVAFDLNNATCKNQAVVKLLSDHGWWRTIRDDNCHFTYLGWNTERQLKENGMKKVVCPRSDTNYAFWVPRIKSFSFTPYRGWECHE